MKDKAGGMVVEVGVKVKVADRHPRSRFSEARLEKEAVAAVAACLAKERTIKFKEASLLELDQGKRGFEGGMPLDCGLSERVRLHPDGSWSYPYPEGHQKSGRTFASLLQFVQQQLGGSGRSSTVEGKKPAT
jgi:hypothetical protein